MKKINVNLGLVLLLVVVSILIYLLQIIQFNSPRDTAFYFLQDMAFLPLQIAIVTIVLKKILSTREKRERLRKMNMVISAFFSEAGTDMVISLIKFNKTTLNIKSHLRVTGDWGRGDFQKAVRQIKGYDFDIDSRASDLEELKILLREKRDFLLRMLENPNLLEHDTFTDMLWAVFHLTDELIARDSFLDLPDTDLNHLSIDMNRAFGTLLVEWINYIAHLKSDYPYLFSMAVRRNPFSENTDYIIK